MSDLFDYGKWERNHQDAYTVIADAIKRIYGTEEKIPQQLPRIMARIIDEGFLNCVLEDVNQLIKHNKKLEEETSEKARRANRELNDIAYKITTLQHKQREIEDRIVKLREIEATEDDPVLRGAKKSFMFVKENTRDNTLATKAFDSYVLANGKKKEETDEQQTSSESSSGED